MPKPETQEKSSSEDMWRQKAQNFKDAPKFLPKAKQIQIYPATPPIETEIDGKWGKRKMYIVDSNIGLVYVSPMQLQEIDSRLSMRGDYDSPLAYP